MAYVERHCQVHGEYLEQETERRGCPECREAEERSAEAQEAALQVLRDLEETQQQAVQASERAAYLTNNPGDYECPSCFMTSLKRGASRCPKCQEKVPPGYWREIREEEERREAERRRRQEEAARRQEELRRQKQKAHTEWLQSSAGQKATERSRLLLRASAFAPRVLMAVTLLVLAAFGCWFALKLPNPPIRPPALGFLVLALSPSCAALAGLLVAQGAVTCYAKAAPPVAVCRAAMRLVLLGPVYSVVGWVVVGGLAMAIARPLAGDVAGSVLSGAVLLATNALCVWRPAYIVCAESWSAQAAHARGALACEEP